MEQSKLKSKVGKREEQLKVEERSPSVPLNEQDLRAVGSSRLTKQANKRLALVLVPALVMSIAGVAFHHTNAVDVGLVLVMVAMAGFLGGTIVIARWYDRATKTFASEHAGIFWKEVKGESKDES